MPSPFPGMDPWLESPAHFPDFHSGFLAALRAALNAVLPPPFFAALSTRIYAEESDRNIEPDIDILVPANGSTANGGTATLTRLETELLVVGEEHRTAGDDITERFIEIRTSEGSNRLITAIELLSLSNKSSGSSGRTLYMAKQNELFSTGVHLVEIDLLRGGTHTTQASLRLLRRQAPRYSYHVAITRADVDTPKRAAAIELQQRLPTIPIPLTPEVPAVGVELQPVFDRAYDESLFSRRVKYDLPPDPPLTPEQQVWADGILRARGT